MRITPARPLGLLRRADACTLSLHADASARGHDLNANCAGAVYAQYQVYMEILAGLVAACTLTIGADAASRAADPTNPTQSPLFGDGSGPALRQLSLRWMRRGASHKLERISHTIFIGYGSGIQADVLGMEIPF